MCLRRCEKLYACRQRETAEDESGNGVAKGEVLIGFQSLPDEPKSDRLRREEK